MGMMFIYSFNVYANMKDMNLQEGNNLRFSDPNWIIPIGEETLEP